MNSPSSNLGGFADPVPPPPPHEFYLVLPDGSCIPATQKTCRIVMKRARDEARTQAKIKRHEKAVELQMALEDRAAARRLLQELAEIERDRIRYAARLRVRIQPDKPATRTSTVEKRSTLTPLPSRGSSSVAPVASSWVIDDRGMRGIIWQQSYLGRKSPNFYRGAARDNWEYDVRDEAVLLDAEGEPIIVSNMGDDWVEIGAGWQALEDAKIQIRAIGPFDADMSPDEMAFALRHFCGTVLEPLGLPYSAVIHKPSEAGDQRNFHPHLGFSLRPMRRVAPYAWEVADEVRGELDGKDGVQMLRHLWAHSMTAAAEEFRSNRAYTGLGYGARGLNLEAGEHLGEARAAMVKRGEQVWTHERNRIKNARNAARRAMRDADRKIDALTRVRDAALAAMAQTASAEQPKRLLHVVEPLDCSGSRTLNSSNGQHLVARRILVAGGRTGTINSATKRQTASIPAQPAPPRHKIGTEDRTRFPDHRMIASRARTAITDVPMLQSTRIAATKPPAERMRSSELAFDHSEQPLTSVSDRHAPQSRTLRPSTKNGRTAHLLTPSKAPASGSAPIQLIAAVPANPITPQSSSKRPFASAPLAASSADMTATHLVDEGDIVDQRRGRLHASKSRDKDLRVLRPASTPPDSNRFGAQLAEMLDALNTARRKKEREAAKSSATRRLDAESSIEKRGAGAAKPFKAQEHAQPVDPQLSAIPRGKGRGSRWSSSRVEGWSSRTALEGRSWFEAHPRTAFEAPQVGLLDIADRRHLDQVRRRDLYVADYGGGTPLTIDGAKAHALGIADGWIVRPDIQLELATIRADQQSAITALAGEASSRPQDFTQAGSRFWPRDLDPRLLQRLDRWAKDDGFQRDVFAIEQKVRASHDSARRSRPAPARAYPHSQPKPAKAFSDGFGGVRDTAPLPFTGDMPVARVAAFDRASGKPTDQLLMLIDLAARHPHAIEFAADDRLMAKPGAPALIAPLLHGWRNDDVIAGTVRLSRAEGKPAWPDRIAASVRGYVARQTPAERGPVDWSSGPTR